MIIFTKFHEDRRKIVGLLLIANFHAWELFSTHPLLVKNSTPFAPSLLLSTSSTEVKISGLNKNSFEI